MITFIVGLVCLVIGLAVGAFFGCLWFFIHIASNGKFKAGGTTYTIKAEGPSDPHWAEAKGATTADLLRRDEIRRVLHEQMTSGQYDSSIERAIQRNNQRKGQAIT